MNIGSIGSIQNVGGSFKPQGVQGNDDAFKSFLDAAMGVVNNTNDLQYQANKVTNDFIAGKDVDLHTMIIAQEKASVAIQFTTQMRNSLMESYREIMRMQM